MNEDNNENNINDSTRNGILAHAEETRKECLKKIDYIEEYYLPTIDVLDAEVQEVQVDPFITSYNSQYSQKKERLYTLVSQIKSYLENLEINENIMYDDKFSEVEKQIENIMLVLTQNLKAWIDTNFNNLNGRYIQKVNDESRFKGIVLELEEKRRELEKENLKLQEKRVELEVEKREIELRIEDVWRKKSKKELESQLEKITIELDEVKKSIEDNLETIDIISEEFKKLCDSSPKRMNQNNNPNDKTINPTNNSQKTLERTDIEGSDTSDEIDSPDID